MTIRWQSWLEGDLLVVEADGEDDDLVDVQNYGMGVIAEARRAGVRHVLCDERRLRYRIGMGDTWAAAAAMAEQVPALARVALVPAPEAAEMARFWENTAWTRGLQCRICPDLETARRWLKESASPAS